jgi:hypothetical protein
VRELRARLQTQKPASLDYALTAQALSLATSSRDAWDGNWRLMGRRGADLRRLSASLLSLRLKFLAANVSLRSLQARERASASVFSFTPPRF